MRRGAGLGRRGFALADFFTGTLLLAGVMATFTALTRAKFEAIAEGELHARGVAALEEALDDVARRGLAGQPGGTADEAGFRLVSTFAPEDAALTRGEGRIEARYLRVAGGEAHGLYEVRVRVSWRGPTGRGSVSACTVAPLPPADEGGGAGGPR